MTENDQRMRVSNCLNIDLLSDLAEIINPNYCLARLKFQRCADAKSRTVHKARSTPATMSKQRSTLLPKIATMSNAFCVKISYLRQNQMLLRKSRTLLRHCCQKQQHCCWCGPGLRETISVKNFNHG